MGESQSMSPIQINEVRGQFVESKHKISGLVVDSDGNRLFEFGNADQKTFPRSSLKPLQAIPMVQSGAVEKYELSDIEIALACASHSGEADHVARVESWLKRINLSKDNLECGAHAPARQEAALNLAGAGQSFHAGHNNCSGKHAGMLCTALVKGEPLKGYINYDHPVQQRIKKVIEDFCDVTLTEKDYAIDGCSIPTFFMPLSSLALGMARLSNPFSLPINYQPAAQRILKACIENPFYIAGTDRYCTKMTTALNKQGFVKVGAEGVMIACLSEKKIGVALKCDDGGTRGAEVAMSYVLSKLEVLDELARAEFLSPKLVNWNKIETGYLAVDL